MMTAKTAILAAGAIVAAALAVAQPKSDPYEAVTVALPVGNPSAGRQAFQDLKCYLCHRVSGETQFPEPVGDASGPDLGEAVKKQAASDVAAAIVAPSHSVSLRTSEAVKERLAREWKSPMGDFSSVLTVRQLADLLAYLRSRGGRP